MKETRMSITLTDKAANEVKKIITEQKLAPETVLRVGVAGGGCSGFSYSLGFDTQYDPKADTTSTMRSTSGASRSSTRTRRRPAAAAARSRPSRRPLAAASITGGIHRRG
jgi:hypothetical protein